MTIHIHIQMLIALLILIICCYHIALRRFRKKIEILNSEFKQKGAYEFYEKILDVIPDPIFVKNKSHQWIYGNAGFTNIISMKQEDYYGKSDYDIFPKEMADVFWEKDNLTLEQLKTTENEELIVSGEEVRIVLTKKTPFQTRTGETILVGIIRDITDRKIQAKTIENLFQMIENSSDLYCIFNLKGQPTYLNLQAIELGMTLAADHFKQFFDLTVDINEIENSLQAKGSWEGEVLLWNFNKNMPVLYWARFFNITNEQNEIASVAIVATNLQFIKESEAKLIYSAKMSSLGEFSSHMAHEINNPLAIISGSADKLIRMFVADEVNADNALSNIRKIKDTVFRISKIIQGLKSFSRNEENDLKKQVDLCNLIEEVMVLGSDRLLMENINLKYEFLNRPMFNCRPTEIQQVIINLVNNSIDAISGKQNPWIVIRCEVDKDEIKLTIIDSGKGIQPDIQKKLMIPFFTTKEAGKGTGLGLSISKGLIENNDGQLDYIQGSPNTSFRLLFKIK